MELGEYPPNSVIFEFVIILAKSYNTLRLIPTLSLRCKAYYSISTNIVINIL